MVVAIGIGTLALILIALWRAYGGHEPLSVAGENLLRAVAQRDSDRVLSYLQPEELATLGGDQDAVRSFLQDFVFPELSGLNPEGSLELIPNAGAGSLTLVRQLRSTDGRTTDVSIQIIEGSSGSCCESLVHSLFLSVLAARYERIDAIVQGVSRQEKRVAAMDEVMVRLESLPLKGVAVALPGGRYEFQSWRAYRDRTESRLRRMQSAVQAGRPN